MGDSCKKQIGINEYVIIKHILTNDSSIISKVISLTTEKVTYERYNKFDSIPYVLIEKNETYVSDNSN